MKQSNNLLILIKLRFDYEQSMNSLIKIDLIFQKKLNEHRYRTVDELEADVMLLCKNAQEFNMENSNVRFHFHYRRKDNLLILF